MPGVFHEAFYDHPGCGCRDHDEKPHAHCVTCGKSFIPEVDYGEPYRFCPVCGVQFTVCRWRSCVDRSYAIPAGVAAGLSPVCLLINDYEFAKTSDIWLPDATHGTHTNRVVVFRKAP